MSKNGHDFQVGDHVVYPAHGVGNVQGIEAQEVAGLKLELYVITFDHEKMTLRVPIAKAKTAGLRPLAEATVVSQALTTLKGRARVKRTMWSRRAQEYEAKINSGDLISIAEVVRDLHRAENQPEQSYSERQLYESALDRMAREVAAIERIDRDAAIGILNKSLVKAVAA
ncbi:MAG: CarD family transcriptional regulator [Proteobacteria bacterium]|nr:CarD family transcriptional regulator [Pseudomonadota bacterium]